MVLNATPSGAAGIPIVVPELWNERIGQVVRRGLGHAAALGLGSVDLEVDPGDAAFVEALAPFDVRPDDDGLAECWLAVEERPEVSPIADGYVLVRRSDERGTPHPNVVGGPDIEARLRETSLYRDELDLVVRTEQGDVAAYGLFWFDPTTATGVVEPMRTVDEHQRRGLARHVLTSGVEMLAVAGAERIKICHELGQPAGALYRDVGFRAVRETRFHTVATPDRSVMPYTKRRVELDELTMAAVDHGDGPAIVFLHGNPTSSYLWRNVVPHVEHLGRCVAPDLIGFGDSDPVAAPGPGSYRFVENRHHLDQLLEALDLGERIVLVLHDWGSGLGFDWARRHPERIAGIAYLEANVAPRSWSQLSDEARGFFARLRTDDGERMALDENVFLERGLPGGVIRELTDAELIEYRRPFLEPGERRRPTLTWPREIPFDGEPGDVHEIVAAYADWLAGTDLPKLLIDVSDGDTLSGPLLEFARTLTEQTEVRVEGRHFAQEDSPDEIGRALANWIAGLDRSS